MRNIINFSQVETLDKSDIIYPSVLNARIAQLVEQTTYTRPVLGSSPSACTNR